MLVVGLTGGIASGKSTISSFFQKLGAVIIDADILARELVIPHSPAWQEIVQHFGTEILQADGTLQRKKLGDLIFQSSSERKVLNRIMHPRIKEKIREAIRVHRQKEVTTLLIVVAPLLIEAQMTELVDEIWLVVLPENLQLQRLTQRDNLSIEDAYLRMAAQLPLQEKIKYATRVIDNSGPPAETQKRVVTLWQEVTQKA